MPEDRSFADLMACFQAGDDEAAARIFRQRLQALRAGDDSMS